MQTVKNHTSFFDPVSAFIIINRPIYIITDTDNNTTSFGYLKHNLKNYLNNKNRRYPFYFLIYDLLSVIITLRLCY